MFDAAMLLSLFLTACLGFACLALSQQRHWETATGGKPHPAALIWPLRSAGVVLLAVSCVIAIVRDGPDCGALLWGTTLSVAAFGIVATLAALNRRRSIRNTTIQPDDNEPQPARPSHV
ncbi:MAG: DUF3325 domain-containing protein [Pseudomonadota bacterium]